MILAQVLLILLTLSDVVGLHISLALSFLLLRLRRVTILLI
jgi:hypothetical protein